MIDVLDTFNKFLKSLKFLEFNLKDFFALTVSCSDYNNNSACFLDILTPTYIDYNCNLVT